MSVLIVGAETINTLVEFLATDPHADHIFRMLNKKLKIDIRDNEADKMKLGQLILSMNEASYNLRYSDVPELVLKFEPKIFGYFLSDLQALKSLESMLYQIEGKPSKCPLYKILEQYKNELAMRIIRSRIPAYNDIPWAV